MQFIINNLITVENKLRMIQMKGAAHILEGSKRKRMEWRPLPIQKCSMCR
jgi:hypothetical protein